VDFGGAIVVIVEIMLSLKDCGELFGLSLFVWAALALSLFSFHE
jgi:hypothetical protein